MDNFSNVDSIRVLSGLPDLKTVSSELLDEQWDIIYVSELHFVDTRQGGKAEERKKRRRKGNKAVLGVQLFKTEC